MTDWNAASEHLSKPLDPKHVKGRAQGGGQVQYIEGWHAIAEMNRIFGFGEWSRETVELRQLGEAREVNGKFRVDYMARVRVTVGGITRDGCGFGQGIDRDVGQAHESGLKEAETDAMKRAMMTFGNPFGLALYDKSRENVRAPEETPAEMRDRLKEALQSQRDVQTLAKLWKQKTFTAAFARLPEPMQGELTRVYSEQTARVCQAPENGAQYQ
ncbi:Rad52/Rad22 family DNA repair protein [Salipiger thiooxidans]|uniref:Rad52/Rad22 family DNA repair protein n=1 Tax=Salipiger thiooxidans TaxID=282683 RepID=UPI001CD37EF7|nr:RAD52 family DNA repair protein [Salipiger thiooxidans]MCA0846084.1 RAD52 family DNA repair protein [Salipiger thiooxidans]